MDYLWQWSGLGTQWALAGGWLLASHLVQAIVLGCAAGQMLGALLSALNFAYAQDLGSWWVLRAGGALLLTWGRAWEQEWGWLSAGVVFAAGLTALYVYDCCGNISEGLGSGRLYFGWPVRVGSYCLMLASTGWVYWRVEVAEQRLDYPHLGVYLTLLLLLVGVHLLRRRHFLYTLSCLLTSNYLVMSRHFLAPWLPLSALPVLMMAFDAQRREQDTLRSKAVSGLFRSCACLTAFELLRSPTFPLELAVAGVAVLAGILNR